MRWSVFFVLALLTVLAGCDLNKREHNLQLKEEQLNQKEQELMLREQSLQLREEEVAKKEKLLDSTNKNVDSLARMYPNVSGTWNVTMRCTETTCAGSAVGDTRTEQWEISITNNTIVAKSISDRSVARVYSGGLVGNTFELSAPHDNQQGKTADIVVRLQPAKENEMAGHREIIRPNDCRILYALELRKQQ